MSVSVVLPAYKEAENLKVLLPKICAALEQLKEPWEVLVVDTRQPTDDTKKVCEENGVTYVPRENGDFYGDAIRTGIAKAQQEYIVVMDADGSHDPADILRFYRVAQEKACDLVIGSRYMEGGNTHNGFILRLMSRMVNLAYQLLFQLKIKDVSDSYRLYRAEQLKSLPLQCSNFDIVEEILILLKVYYPSVSIVEVPIYFNKRVHGESKRDLVKFILSYLSTIVKLMKIRKDARRKQRA